MEAEERILNLERSILGAILIDKDGYCETKNLLKDYKWNDKRHFLIYRAIGKLVKKNMPVDVISVADCLKKDNLLRKSGGPLYINELSVRVASTCHLLYHASILGGGNDAKNMVEAFNRAQDVVDVDFTRKTLDKYFDIVSVPHNGGTLSIKVRKNASRKQVLDEVETARELFTFELKKDAPMTTNEYQAKATATCLETSNNNAYCLLGLAEETGEVMGKVAKAIRKGWVSFGEDNNLKTPIGQAKEYKEWKELLKKELGDVMWMVSQVARTMGWSLDEICKDNLEKLADRQSRSVIDSEGDRR